jgi:hypothetical protein
MLGAVVDITGAVIPRATIRLIADEFRVEGMANDRGEYRVELPEGVYRLEAWSPGFHTTKAHSIRLAKAEQKRLPAVPLMVDRACAPAGVVLDLSKDPDAREIRGQVVWVELGSTAAGPLAGHDVQLRA